jgi:hypothetical protein
MNVHECACMGGGGGGDRINELRTVARPESTKQMT